MARHWMLGAAIAALVATDGAGAQDAVPAPSVDYAATGSFVGGGKMQIRHRAGMMRIELEMTGAPFPMVGYFDRATGKAVMVVETPAGRMGMEVAAADQAGYGAPAGAGVRTGQDAVAGEPCEVWKVEPAGGAGPVFSCITADGIALRTQTEQAGKRETVFEVASLTRAPQDPALFRVPANLKLLTIPGLRGPFAPTPGASR